MALSGYARPYPENRSSVDGSRRILRWNWKRLSVFVLILAGFFLRFDSGWRSDPETLSLSASFPSVGKEVPQSRDRHLCRKGSRMILLQTFRAGRVRIHVTVCWPRRKSIKKVSSRSDVWSSSQWWFAAGCLRRLDPGIVPLYCSSRLPTVFRRADGSLYIIWKETSRRHRRLRMPLLRDDKPESLYFL